MGEQVLTPAGLYTAANPYSQVPMGALREGTNVVLRQPGILEPRPGFQPDAFSSPPGGYTPRRLIPFEEETLVIGKSGSNWRADWAEAETQCTLPTASNTFDEVWIRGALARGQLYLSTKTDVVRTAKAGTASSTRFDPGLYILPTKPAGTIVPAGFKVAYRALVRRTIASGFEVTGVPSFAFEVTDSADISPTVTVSWSTVSPLAVGDVLELYRSVAVLAENTAPDELFLVASQTLTSSDVSAGSYTFTDATAEASLGKSLYTNPSQEGLDQANFPPPHCKDVALFRGSVFYSNARLPHALEIVQTLATIDDDVSGKDRSGSATGLGYRDTNTTTTSGSPTATVASATGLKVGMLIDNNANIPAGTYVLSIVSTTVTMSANATGSATATARYWDTLKIERGATIERHKQYGSYESVIRSLLPSSALVAAVVTYAPTLAATQTVAGEGRITLVARDAGTTKFTVWATHGSEYFPVLPEPSESTGKDSTQESDPARLYWSKTDQPEHVPLLNYVRVGDNSPIVRIVPTRDALLVLKRDGLYRLTGAGAAEGWRVDPMDPSLRLLAPETAQELGGAVYALTNQGVVRISESGADNISEDWIGNRLYYVQRALDQTDLTTASHLVAWAVTNEKDDEYILTVPTASALTAPALCLVWNVRTQAWTEWDTLREHGCATRGQLVMAATDSYTLHKERYLDGTLGPYDNSGACTIASIVGLTITISGGSGWTPAVGDVIGQSGSYGVVTGVTSSTVFAVDQTTGLSAAAATFYEGFSCTVEFQARHGGAPSVPKAWYELTWMFGSLKDMDRYVMSFTSDQSESAVTLTRDLQRGSSSRVRFGRTIIPRRHARSHILYPKLTITQAIAQWSLLGLALLGEGTAPRGTRKAASA